MSKRPPKRRSWQPPPPIRGDDPIDFRMHSIVYVPKSLRGPKRDDGKTMQCCDCGKRKFFKLAMVLGHQRLWKRLGWFVGDRTDARCGCCMSKRLAGDMYFRRSDDSIIVSARNYAIARLPRSIQ